MTRTAINSTQEQTQNVSIIALKTSDGRYVASKYTYDAPVVASNTATDLFELAELGSGRVALRAFSSGKYVSAHPETGLAANREEIGPPEIFTLIQREEGKVAFQLSDGIHYLSVQPGNGEVVASAISVGPTELFSTQPVTLEGTDDAEGAGSTHSCCGPRHATSAEVGVVWNDETHYTAVRGAAALLMPGLTDEARKFAELWNGSPDFREAIKSGLRDADYEYPWRGTNLGVAYMYNDHFYDPDTRLNYMNQASSAMTEGRRYFNLSVQVGMRIVRLGSRAPAALYSKAGYYLGLSLHFLTDLTQPMHAANFANVFGQGYPWPNLGDQRHKGFEDYTENRVRGGYFRDYPPLKPEDLYLSDIRDAGWFLHHTAVNQKRVFDGKVNPEAEKKVKWIGDPPVIVFDNSWGAESNPALEAALKPAPKAVARYLAYWTRCIQQPLNIDPRYWYRILEPRSNWKEWVCLRNGHFVRGNDTGGNSLFFVLFNSDGTCSLACKDWKANPWFVYKASNSIYYIGEYKNARNSPDPWARFRVVPIVDMVSVADGKVWIFEPSLDEVVGVGPDGYLVRWNPCDEASQLFAFQQCEEISKEDQEQIRNIWPHYGKLPWWGGAISPEVGGSGGGPFDDVAAAPADVIAIKSVRIRHGWMVDAIQVEYLLSNGKTYTAAGHGGGGGGESTITFEEGETIIRVEGRSGSLIDQLTFTTRTRSGKTQTYGPYGGGGGGPFVIGGNVKGFFGRSGSMLDAIGVYLD